MTSIVLQISKMHYKLSEVCSLNYASPEPEPVLTHLSSMGKCSDICNFGGFCKGSRDVPLLLWYPVYSMTTYSSMLACQWVAVVACYLTMNSISLHVAITACYSKCYDDALEYRNLCQAMGFSVDCHNVPYSIHGILIFIIFVLKLFTREVSQILPVRFGSVLLLASH